MDIQVTLTLENSSQTYSSSCIFKCLWAELFFQLHIVVLSPVLCNCWSLIDVCEKSIFSCQSRPLSCTCKANTQGYHPRLEWELQLQGHLCLWFWTKFPLTAAQTMHQQLEGGLQWARAKASPGHSLLVYPIRKLNIPETLTLGMALGLLLITLCAALWQIQIKACKGSLFILDDWKELYTQFVQDHIFHFVFLSHFSGTLNSSWERPYIACICRVSFYSNNNNNNCYCCYYY